MGSDSANLISVPQLLGLYRESSVPFSFDPGHWKEQSVDLRLRDGT